jgi:phytoene dehydrogenase-like protein
MPAQMTDVDVVVIGAGCGGLSAAALLAGHGRRVLILDQNDAVGGCASSFEREGYAFDVAASIFEVLEPLKRTLAMLGTSVEQEIDLLSGDPTCAVALRDGKRITFSMGGMVRTVSRGCPDWSRYASYCEELYNALLDTLYVQPVSTLGELVGVLRKRPARVKYLPAFLTSYQAVLARYFSDRTQQALAFQALTLGLPPALLPGIYSFLPYGALRSPHYPRGGMIQIPRTLQRLGERHGMRVQLGARVTKVLVERRRAIGVQLADGTEIRSDVVVSNINAKTLY